MFERLEDTCEVLNPLKRFEKETQRIEIRRDPLLSHTSLYNPLIEDKVNLFVGEMDRELIPRLAAESASHCFFWSWQDRRRRAISG